VPSHKSVQLIHTPGGVQLTYRTKEFTYHHSHFFLLPFKPNRKLFMQLGQYGNWKFCFDSTVYFVGDYQLLGICYPNQSLPTKYYLPFSIQPVKILMGCSNQEKIFGAKLDTVLMKQEYLSLQPSAVSIQNYLPQVTTQEQVLALHIQECIL
jgi:hypothetical protein